VRRFLHTNDAAEPSTAMSCLSVRCAPLVSLVCCGLYGLFGPPLVACGGAGVVEDLGSDTSPDAGGGKEAMSSTPTAPTCAGGTGCVLAVGDGAACAITSSGGVRCWGDNLFGQLGNGVAGGNGSSVAVDVKGLDGPVVQLALGDYFACALTRTGKVQCWGDDGDGEIGAAVSATCTEDACATTATLAASLPAGISSIGAGELSVYAIVNGAIQGWGDNGDSSLANTSGGGMTPVPIMGLASAVQVTGGLDTGCVVTTSSGVKCWGWGEHGQIGNGGTSDAVVPTDVTGLTTGVRSVASGGTHTCALLTSGGVECWGENSYGELGDGSTTDSTLPVQVSGLGGGDGGDAIVAITAGDFNTCALTSAGGVKCWGQVLGSHTPTDVPGLSSGVTAVAVGPTQICAMTTSGSVLCQSGGSSPATAVPGFP